MNKPSLMTRLRLAGRIARGLFDEDSARAMYGMFAGILQGGRGEPPVRGTKAQLEAYGEVPWLRACAERIARGTSAVTWKLYVRQGKVGRPVRMREWQRGDIKARTRIRKDLGRNRELWEITDHPLLDVIHSGNSYFTGRLTRKLNQISIDLVGEWFNLVERNAFGMPVALWPLPAHWVNATPTPANPRYALSFRGWNVDIPEDDVLWQLNPNPANPYGRGSGLAKALADEIDTDDYAAKHLRNWFFNSARPDLIVSGEGLTKDASAVLEDRWMASHGSRAAGLTSSLVPSALVAAFKPFFLNKAVEVKEIGQTFEEMELRDLRQFQRDLMMQVFGIPPEIMGVIQNSNRATIESADFLFARHVLVPRLEEEREFLQERLAVQYDDRLVLDYESPVSEDQEFALKVVQAAPWSHLVDEIRELTGRPELPNGRGKVFVAPFNMVASEEPAGGAKRGTADPDPGGAPPPDPDDEDIDDEEAAA